MLIKKSVAWISIAQLGTLTLAFASSIVVARHITPREMGIFAIGVAVAGIISLFQQLSLPAFLIREEKLNDNIIATAFSINAAVTTMLALLIFAGSFVLGALFSEPGVESVLAVLALSPIPGIFAFVPSSILERQGRFKRLSIISIVSNVVTYLTSIVLVLMGFSYMSLAYGLVAGSVVSGILMISAGHQYFTMRIGIYHWRRIAKFSAQMLVISGASQGGRKICEIVLGSVQGLAGLGLYNRASGLINMVWSSIYQISGRILLVRFSEVNRNRGSFREDYLAIMSIATAILWPTFAGLAVVAEPLILLVYGESWLGAAGPFMVLAVAAIVGVPAIMNYQLLVSTGKLTKATGVEVTRTAIGVGAFMLGSLLSVTAAAASRIIEAISHVSLYRPHIIEITGVTWSDAGPIYMKSGSLTVVATAPAAISVYIFGGVAVPIPILTAAILCGVSLWIAGLFILRHPLLSFLVSYVPKRLRVKLGGAAE